jgi:hypothetical protein
MDNMIPFPQAQSQNIPDDIGRSNEAPRPQGGACGALTGQVNGNLALLVRRERQIQSFKLPLESIKKFPANPMAHGHWALSPP